MLHKRRRSWMSGLARLQWRQSHTNIINLLFVVSDTGINPGRGLFYCDDINPVGIAPSLRPVG